MSKKAPNTIKRTVPIRKKNEDIRSREHLTPNEIERLMKAAHSNRRGHRDETMILIAYRHGLRASEACNLRWDQFDLKHGMMHVKRLKNGLHSTHHLGGKELRALRKLQSEEPESRFVFLSERGAPMSVSGFRTMVERAGVKAGFPFSVHPHMLRHACGYKLANDGKDTRAIQLYMGHKNIQNTVEYMQLSAERFKDFWAD